MRVYLKNVPPKLYISSRLDLKRRKLFVKRILEAEVYERRNRGRQRKRWISTISWQDLISLNLTPVDAEDRDDWRRRTSTADPPPEGFTA